VPYTLEIKQQLQMKMGFNYHQVISEVIYPMMKCYPDIAFHATKLSQYMENPAEEHYKALQQLCTYLAATITDGIYYWRHTPQLDLPLHSNPELNKDNYAVTIDPYNHEFLVGYVDADWASDMTHQKSITGIILMYAGGTIGYWSKYQDTIPHSSTEAEFTAAFDAGKLILFFRSLLANLHVEQTATTILHEDNNGALMMANVQQCTRRT
jgi:hypothetical protein